MSKRIHVKLTESDHSEFMKSIRYDDDSSFQEFSELCVKAYLAGKLPLEMLQRLNEID